MEKADFYRDARRDLSGPLHGLRVLEATTTWSGPMCGCVLADLGADVIKVEDPRGEVARRSPPMLPGTNVSFMHATVNRNKRSLTLDLRNAEAREIFLRLAERCDVLIENFRPGVTERYGIDYAHVRARRPDVVYVSISGWGQFGPDHERPGYDPLTQAASGFLSLNGSPEGEPVKTPTFLADDLSGLHGALAALAALRHRDASGEGQHVDVSLLDALLFQSAGYLTLAAMGESLPRLGNEFRIAAPASAYPARDGWVMAGVLLDSHWKALAHAIGHGDLADDPAFATTGARVARRETVNRLLGDWIAARGADEAAAELAAAGLPVSVVRTYGDAAKDPHVRERDMLQDTLQEDGRSAPITGPAAKLSRTPLAVRSGAPALGAHNDEILDELGVDAETRRRLREAGAL